MLEFLQAIMKEGGFNAVIIVGLAYFIFKLIDRILTQNECREKALMEFIKQNNTAIEGLSLKEGEFHKEVREAREATNHIMESISDTLSKSCALLDDLRREQATFSEIVRRCDK